METLAEEIETGAACAEAVFRPAVAIAVAALTVRAGELACLLRPLPGGRWSLPCRPPRAGETLDQAARAALSPAAFGTEVSVEQLFTRSVLLPEADEPALEVAYVALVPPPRTGTAGFPEGHWQPLTSLAGLLPAHAEVIERARERARQLLEATDAARSLLPGRFTLSDLQAVYEAVHGRSLDKRNFRKWAFTTGLVEPTPEERRHGPHRPARLYCFAGAGSPSPNGSATARPDSAAR